MNVVFARGMSPDALTQGLRGLLREPLTYSEADGWAWAVHDMHNPDADGAHTVRIIAGHFGLPSPLLDLGLVTASA